jgi:hypothetical protein
VKRETGHPSTVIETLLAAPEIEADLYLVSRNTKDLQQMRFPACRVLQIVATIFGSNCELDFVIAQEFGGRNLV